MKSIRRNRLLLLFLLPFALLVLGFELLPLVGMTVDSLHDGDTGQWSWVQYATALGSKFYLQALQNSVLISFCSSLVGILVAIVAAYSITRLSPGTRDIILMLSNMTSNFAGVPLAFAYMILLGNNGIFTLLLHKWGWDVFASFNLYSWIGLTLVYVYFQIPLAILLLYPAYYGIQRQWKEAALLLGASPLRFWLHIGIPVILPGVVGTFSILFANAMGAYATAYALVGSNYNLLAVRIGALVSGDVVSQPQLASALAVILAVTMVGAMWINERMMRRVRRDLQ
ncbi:ABC transporter permease [Effusibacillus pohliae]|uniref:ABC transporter permease n=1 Tax=Effusibacillus pohliae TaxID=232270 RepID=UPI0003605A04|nr:ABC transporter permease subunit [Effusibacillus pohliae]